MSTQITKPPDCPQKSFLVVPDHLCNSDMFGHTVLVEIGDADGVPWCKIFIFSPCPDMRRPSVVRVCSPLSMAFYSHREKVALVNTRTRKPFVTVCPRASLGLHASFVNTRVNPALKKGAGQIPAHTTQCGPWPLQRFLMWEYNLFLDCIQWEIIQRQGVSRNVIFLS